MARREKIAERLVNLRGNRTIKEVSEQLNISKSALAMYETAKRMPRDEVKIKIARFYETSVEAIFFS